MQRWKIWQLEYSVNNRLDSLNYGASTFKLAIPIFAFIIRFWDCLPTKCVIATGVEIAWEWNIFRVLNEGDSWYKNQLVIFEKSKSLRELYIEDLYATKR